MELTKPLPIKWFALGAACLMGLALLTVTWVCIWTAYEPIALKTLAKLYVGYQLTPIGSIIGCGWAALDGLLSGALFAWVINAVARPAPKMIIQ